MRHLMNLFGPDLAMKEPLCIFDPIKKLKLSTFSSMNKIKKCKVNSKIIPMQATKELFAKISLVAQNRSLDMRSVFKFPLGPLPWSCRIKRDIEKNVKGSINAQTRRKCRDVGKPQWKICDDF